MIALRYVIGDVLRDMCCFSGVMVMKGSYETIVLRYMAGVYLGGCVMFKYFGIL